MAARIACCALLCLAFGAARSSTASSQQTAAEAKLTLGEPSAPPGSPVTIPLTLSMAESVSVGSVEIRLTYPKAQLTFNKVESSGLVLGIEATVEAALENSARPETLHGAHHVVAAPVKPAQETAAGRRAGLPRIHH